MYLAVVAPFLLVPAALLPFGVSPEVSLGFALLFAIVFSVLSTIRIFRQYLRLSEPRSAFFGMLVSALAVKQTFGVWIGYLIAANLFARPDTLAVALPIPDMPIRSLLNAVAGVALLVTAIYYDLSIQTEIRRQRQSGGLEL